MRVRIAVAVSLVCGCIGLGLALQTPSAASTRPNIIVVTIDDGSLADLRALPATQELIAEGGASFANSFVQFPLCCPSRATFLTGQYAHNHGVLDNFFPEGGFRRFEDRNTLPVWLRRAGYFTAMAGRYLNEYQPAGRRGYIPRGWSDWRALTRLFRYFGHQFNENGKIVEYGLGETDYVTDVINRHALDVIAKRAPSERPFFLWVAHAAPHVEVGGPFPSGPERCEGKATPAPRHEAEFADAELPGSPGFDEADVSDKARMVRALERVSEDERMRITERYRCGLASLRSVDEGMAEIVDALTTAGELENTYIFFTSDNGFMNGEHRVTGGKHYAYEEAIRVPLFLRGPGIEAGTGIREMAVNADLAPTLARIANADPRRRLDGRSLLPILADPERTTRRNLLIHVNKSGRAAEDAMAIRTPRYTFVRFRRGGRELYDLRTDPFQLESMANDWGNRSLRRRLARKLRVLEGCRGAVCRRTPQARR